MRLRRLGQGACIDFPQPTAKRALSIIVIESLNTWAMFVRSFYLSCTIRAFRVRGGRVTVTNYSGSSFNDAIGIAVRWKRPSAVPLASGEWHRRDEPAWHDINVLLSLSAQIGCSNLSQIQAALSVQTKVFEHLPVYRNYFGHRNPQTARAARQFAAHYSIPGYDHLYDILVSMPSGRPVSLLLDWLDDMRFVMEFLCE